MHKEMARTLRADLAQYGLNVSLALSLELTAALCGVSDWNTLKARQTPPLPLSAAVAALRARMLRTGQNIEEGAVESLVRGVLGVWISGTETEAGSPVRETLNLSDFFQKGGLIYVGLDFPVIPEGASAVLNRALERPEMMLVPDETPLRQEETAEPTWPSGAYLGAQVLLQNGWYQQRTGVIVRITKQDDQVEYTIMTDLPGRPESEVTFNRHGRDVHLNIMDDYEPCQILPRDLSPDLTRQDLFQATTALQNSAASSEPLEKETKSPAQDTAETLRDWIAEQTGQNLSDAQLSELRQRQELKTVLGGETLHPDAQDRVLEVLEETFPSWIDPEFGSGRMIPGLNALMTSHWDRAPLNFHQGMQIASRIYETRERNSPGSFYQQQERQLLALMVCVSSRNPQWPLPLLSGTRITDILPILTRTAGTLGRRAETVLSAGFRAGKGQINEHGYDRGGLSISAAQLMGVRHRVMQFT